MTNSFASGDPFDRCCTAARCLGFASKVGRPWVRTCERPSWSLHSVRCRRDRPERCQILFEVLDGLFGRNRYVTSCPVSFENPALFRSQASAMCWTIETRTAKARKCDSTWRASATCALTFSILSTRCLVFSDFSFQDFASTFRCVASLPSWRQTFLTSPHGSGVSQCAFPMAWRSSEPLKVEKVWEAALIFVKCDTVPGDASALSSCFRKQTFAVTTRVATDSAVELPLDSGSHR